MGVFISVQKTVECVLTAVIFTALYIAAFIKPFGILQSGGYSGKRLFGWAQKKNNAALMRYMLLAMLCALSCAVISLCFSFLGDMAAVCGLAGFALFLTLYIIADKKIALRVPAVFTPRLKRLYAVTAFITGVLVYLAVTLLNFADAVWGNTLFCVLRYVPLAVFPAITLPVIALCNLAAKIYEVPHSRSFVRKAKRKMASSNITVVGITGSYGKTGVKNILAAMLAKKYRVLSTPRSHNTPMGLAMCINNNNLGDYDVFIAEMGARHVGDIAELCDLLPPDYALITGICSQHLESFKTPQNIVKAKAEILAAAKKGAVIAPDCYQLFKEYQPHAVSADVVENIECNRGGTSFDLCLGGVKIRVHTKLLGAHSARNIGLAAQAAYMLGVMPEDIAAAVEDLEFTEHRLQLLHSGGVDILDDGYNSNVKGAEAALEVLRMFGGRRVVVTPGLVELGVLEQKENYALGQKLAGFDRVILVGDTLIGPVKQGYIQNGGDQSKLSVVPTLGGAEQLLKEYLKEGDAVLFLNDLPDVY